MPKARRKTNGAQSGSTVKKIEVNITFSNQSRILFANIREIISERLAINQLLLYFFSALSAIHRYYKDFFIPFSILLFPSSIMALITLFSRFLLFSPGFLGYS